MFDYQDDRASAQGTFILPMMPEPDGLSLSSSDMQQVQGVYSGIDIGPVTDGGLDIWLIHKHNHGDSR